MGSNALALEGPGSGERVDWTDAAPTENDRRAGPAVSERCHILTKIDRENGESTTQLITAMRAIGNVVLRAIHPLRPRGGIPLGEHAISITSSGRTDLLLRPAW